MFLSFVLKSRVLGDVCRTCLHVWTCCNK